MRVFVVGILIGCCVARVLSGGPIVVGKPKPAMADDPMVTQFLEMGIQFINEFENVNSTWKLHKGCSKVTKQVVAGINYHSENFVDIGKGLFINCQFLINNRIHFRQKPCVSYIVKCSNKKQFTFKIEF